MLGAVRDLKTGFRRGKVYLDFFGVSFAAGSLIAVFLLILLLENRIGLPNVVSSESFPESIEVVKQFWSDSVAFLDSQF